MSVYNLANKLAREIKDSDEYQNYLKIRKKIMQDENTLEMLKDYQKQQMNLQSKQLSGQDITEEEKENLQKIQNLVNLNNDIQEYLEAERRINLMLSDLQRILFSDLKLGVFESEEDK